MPEPASLVRDMGHIGALNGKRVLVTGGTGFIGGRIVEKLALESGAEVRVLVRDFSRAARIARLDIDMVPGSVTQPEEVRQAVESCDVVIHCAYGNLGNRDQRRAVNVDGTRNVLAAALEAAVERVVHLSTLMVYGLTPDGPLDETASRRRVGRGYARSKAAAEALAVRYAEEHGLPVAVLQPTVVYGPFGPVWTSDVLRRMKSGRIILVNGGDGLCNPVYVDDVVQSVLLAAARAGAVGQAFLISGPRAVSWREFYGYFERMLGRSRTVSMTAREALAYHASMRPRRLPAEALSIVRGEPEVRRRLRQTRELAALYRLSKKLLPTVLRSYLKPRLLGPGERQTRPGRQAATSGDGQRPHPLSPSDIELYSAKTEVRIDKARALLGYRPEFDLERGMRLTEMWARWAHLIDDSESDPEESARDREPPSAFGVGRHVMV